MSKLDASLDSSLPPITTHYDGYGLNEDIVVMRDNRDASNGQGSHFYLFFRGDVEGEDAIVGRLAFQHGPRKDPGSVPGLTEGAVLAALMDRLEGFQSGPFACEENELALTHLQRAMFWLRKRVEKRAKAGTLGTLKV